MLSSLTPKIRCMETMVRCSLDLRRNCLLTCCSDPEIAVGSNDSEKDHKASLLSRENYPRLQALKKKYDPEVLFSKWSAITPA